MKLRTRELLLNFHYNRIHINIAVFSLKNIE